jgi:hypothetical protein
MDAQGNLFGCRVSGLDVGKGSVFLTQLPKEHEVITGGGFGPEASLIVTIIFIGGIIFAYALLSTRHRLKIK